MDTSYELMIAIINELKASATVGSFVGDNIYDRVPEDQNGNVLIPSPYISIDVPSVTFGDYECVDTNDLTVQLNVYSWGTGDAYASAQCRKICKAIRNVLKEKEFVLNDNGFVSLNHLLTRYTRASDGITNHGVLIFEILIDEME